MLTQSSPRPSLGRRKSASRQAVASWIARLMHAQGRRCDRTGRAPPREARVSQASYQSYERTAPDRVPLPTHHARDFVDVAPSGRCSTRYMPPALTGAFVSDGLGTARLDRRPQLIDQPISGHLPSSASRHPGARSTRQRRLPLSRAACQSPLRGKANSPCSRGRRLARKG